MRVICVLGNQLFDIKHIPFKPGPGRAVFMREDRELCARFRYHKHKIIFFLSAMRKYAAELRRAGYAVRYERLGDVSGLYEARLIKFLRERGCKELDLFEIEDKFFEKRIHAALAEAKIGFRAIQSPMFLTSRAQLAAELAPPKKPFMKAFYEGQRKRLDILIEKNGSPAGGKWSFDRENRKALPRDHKCPGVPAVELGPIDREVCALVDAEFSDHPGDSQGFWLPTDRLGARRWAREFFRSRLALFGAYEDALSRDWPFLYHSVMTPFLNAGLVTPKECVSAALKAAAEKAIPLNSCEGYIRQVIGWREFMRGIYQNYGEFQERANFFGHSGKLSDAWYSGNSGIEPLDEVIRKALKYGYAHHIERLMVAGSLMLLSGIDPKEAYRWFMEMFVDSSDWVMTPNVYGMALFSDGGLFATKPYICGANYYGKMSGYKAGTWRDGVDGLYWTFIRKHKSQFAQNPRMSMMARAVDKIAPARMRHLEREAEKLRARLVSS
jgi:deoxyribodipyrimidine photolyase-related protein